MINKQPAETVGSITGSANTLRSSIENSSERLTDAVIVSSETASENAKQIRDQIALLSSVIMMAGDVLKSAVQSPRLRRRMNLLTAVLIFSALISAGAAAFCAWEAKQLVEVMRQQLQHGP
jgi:hypothetical protein